jgi:hypothetical protein
MQVYPNYQLQITNYVLRITFYAFHSICLTIASILNKPFIQDFSNLT